MQATLAQAAVIALMLLLSEPASIAEESRCDPQRVGVSSMEAELRPCPRPWNAFWPWPMPGST